FSSRRRHTRSDRDWSSDVCSSDLVVLAFLDRRILLRRGIVRPFHWVWSVLPLVYLIGRSVVLRRRVGRGSAPLWVSLLLSVGVRSEERRVGKGWRSRWWACA